MPVEIASADDLWADYGVARAKEFRDRLILHYQPLVAYVAGRVAAGLPQSVDADDLSTDGIFGLIDAIEKFDPGRGFKFETYAMPRIRGAILDGIRDADWAPRKLRAKAKTIDRARARLESELHRAPTDDEVAVEVDMTVEKVADIRSQSGFVGVLALDELVSPERGPVTLGETIAVRENDDGVTAEELRGLLADAVAKLPERERLVLSLYYATGLGLTLAKIGEHLGVSESRASQIHSRAIVQLRRSIAIAQR